MKTNNQLEKEIERALVGMVRQRRGYCLKWVCPGWSGVPDRIILLPGGRVIFAEVKRPKGGKLSAQQVKWAELLKRLGFMHVIPHTLDDVRALADYIDSVL